MLSMAGPSANTLTEPDSKPIFLIRPGSSRIGPRLAEVWRHRELLLFLAWRDLRVRYRQTALGVAWAILQPVLTMLILSIIFGRLVGVPSGGIPYPLFALAGLLVWQLFSFALTSSAGSLVANERLMTKIYFPRLVLPIASVLSGLVDFALGLAILSGLQIAYGVHLGWQLLTVPLFAVLAAGAALAVGIGLSALNVRYRDVKHALPFLAQFWMLCSPVVYPSSLIPQAWQPVYALNPIVGAVEGFRWSLFGQGPVPWSLLAVSTTVVVMGLVISLVYFLSVESTLADVI